MPLLRRQYSIDNHLGRFRKALKHLYDLNDHNEVKSFTVKHVLYADTLDLYRYQEDHLSEIIRLYADNLQKNSCFKEAGIGKFGYSNIFSPLLIDRQPTSIFTTIPLQANPTVLPIFGKNRFPALHPFPFRSSSSTPFHKR